MDDDELRRVVEAQGTTKWDRFLYWSGRFFAEPNHDVFERETKLVVAERLQQARLALIGDDPQWVDLVGQAIGQKPNNLTTSRVTKPLEAWCRDDRETAELAFRALWDADLKVSERFNEFVRTITEAGKKIPITEVSFFHMAMGATEYPIFRPIPVDRAFLLTGYATLKQVDIPVADSGRRYEHFQIFLDRMLKRGGECGVPFRDRLDAQGASWAVTQGSARDDWSPVEQQAFAAYQSQLA